MADLVLIKPPAKHGAKIEAGSTAVVFDATKSETHEQGAQVPRHPVESGVDVAHQIRPTPFRLKLRGTITATPLQDDRKEVDRVRKKHEEMLDLVERGEPVRIVTGLKAYDEMAIENYKANRGPDVGQAIDVQLDLSQIRTVETAEVDIPARILGDSVKAGGQSRKDKGQQTGKEAEEESHEDQRANTWAQGLYEFFRE